MILKVKKTQPQSRFVEGSLKLVANDTWLKKYKK